MEKGSSYKKVVFIDDDRDMVNIYNNILKRKNLSDYLIHFENAKEGIDYLKTQQKKEMPDYILLDLYMPEMSGFEFLKRFENMNQAKKNIEIFVCTSSKNKDDRNRVMKYPFVNAYLEKPLPSAFIELLIKDEN